jgi:DNA invertase Pin-like site-specific DNA recombinase
MRHRDRENTVAKMESALAYSYLRWSSPQQASGDTVRRQTANREAWLAANPHAKLDTSLVMTDAGRSAFRRKGWDTYALARFVECIKAGTIEAGSYLLVENLDRLSREDAGEATELFLSIVNKGVVIVQLAPVVMEFRRPVNVQSLMFAIVELSRGHSESTAKSERVGAAWARKQREAGEKVVTRRLPGWVRLKDGKLVLDRAASATVRRMFAMALAGKGVRAIAQALNAGEVPTISSRSKFKGRAVRWSTSTVHLILTSRAVLGEYQAHTGRGEDRRAVGDPILNYFPRLIEPDRFHAAQAAIRDRVRTGGGRRGRHVNLFSGLLTDATTGGSFTYRHRAGKPSALIPVDGQSGRGGEWRSFPSAAFEVAILSQLAEVSAADVIGGGDAGRKVEALAGEIAEVDTLLRAWTGKMDDASIVEQVAAKLAELNTRRRVLTAEMAAARRDSSSPPAEAWGEFKSLATLLAADTSDELRAKARSALRRAIEGVWCLIVPLGWERILVAQVRFVGGGHRDYLIHHRPSRTVPRSTVRSLLTIPGTLSAGFDLRDPSHAAELKNLLVGIDLTALLG